MVKAFTTAVGMVLLVSSFAMAGQTPTAPMTNQPRVNASGQTQKPGTKKHHKKHHHKHHKAASKR